MKDSKNSTWKEEEEQKRKFVEENPDSIKIFENVVDFIFGKKENRDSLEKQK